MLDFSMAQYCTMMTTRSRLIDSAKHLTVQQTNELKNLTPKYHSLPFNAIGNSIITLTDSIVETVSIV